MSQSTALRKPAPVGFGAHIASLRTMMEGEGKSVDDIRTDLKEYASKCGWDWEDAWVPFGGAQSFADLDSYERATAAEAEVNELTYQFQSIVNNVFASEDMALPAKASAIISAAQDLQTRLTNGVPAAIASALEDEDDEFKELAARQKPIKQQQAPAEAASTTPPQQSTPELAASFKAFRGADGQLRWLTVHSNPFWDRDGERFTMDAHKDFVEYVDASQEFPELRLWHVPGTALGRADWIDVSSEGFVLASGTFAPGMEGAAQRLKEMDNLGVSHGYKYRESDLQGGEFHRYRDFEITILPFDRAANPITGFAATTEVDMSLSKEKRQFVEQVLGKEFTDELEGRLASAAEKAGSPERFKEVMDAIVDAPEPAPAPTEGLTLDGIAAAMKAAAEAAVAPALQRLEQLESSQKELVESSKESADDRLAALVTGRNRPSAGYVASRAEDNTVDMRTQGGKDARSALSTTGVDDVPEHLQEHLNFLRTQQRAS